jgi:hypothetical protein
VIAGPAAVGKTSVANEVSAQLRAADIAHAVIDKLLQAEALAAEAVSQAPVIETDGRTVPDFAAEIVELLGWDYASPEQTWSSSARARRPASPCHQRACPITNVCQAQSALSRSRSMPQ